MIISSDPTLTSGRTYKYASITLSTEGIPADAREQIADLMRGYADSHPEIPDGHFLDSFGELTLIRVLRADEEKVINDIIQILREHMCPPRLTADYALEKIQPVIDELIELQRPAVRSE